MSGDDTSSELIAQRLERVHDRIARAAERGGRDPSSVQLVAVSKRKPTASIRNAVLAGCGHFGENYVQELQQKDDELADCDGLRWHFIGLLQRNKVRALLDVGAKLSLIHGVHSARLMGELHKRATHTIEVLLQVNVSREETKSGCEPQQLPALLKAAADYTNVHVRGLMTMPPPVADPELARSYFRRLRDLRDSHGGSELLPELSMGMSHDFETAIEEGATIIRVGTAIFGKRS